VFGIDGPLLHACSERRSAGLTKLDPSVTDGGRVVRRWNLRVNVDLQARDDSW
jgi:predicted transcriptional regulator of viral defense system